MPNSVFIDGAVRDIDFARVMLPDNTVHDIDEGRVIGDDGSLHYISFGFTPLRRMPIGTRVYANALGRREEFILVQNGKPDSPLYDESSDGLWLLQSRAYEGDHQGSRCSWQVTQAAYDAGYTYGFGYPKLVGLRQYEQAQNGNQKTFYRPYLESLAPYLRDRLLTPRLPYATSAVPAASWPPNQVFYDTLGPVITLSAPEVGFQFYSDYDVQGKPDPTQQVYEDGVPLQFFADASDDDRIARSAQHPEVALSYALRSGYNNIPEGQRYADFACVTTVGQCGRGTRYSPPDTSLYFLANMRPCIITRKDLLIDRDNNIVV